MSDELFQRRLNTVISYECEMKVEANREKMFFFFFLFFLIQFMTCTSQRLNNWGTSCFKTIKTRENNGMQV